MTRQVVKRSFVPDAIISAQPEIPANFWLPSVTKLTLRIANRYAEQPLFGVQCEHGNRTLKAVVGAEAQDRTGERRSLVGTTSRMASGNCVR